MVATLHKATEWQRQLDTGEIASQADMARREGVTRARVCQIMVLARLAPEVRQRILAWPTTSKVPPPGERQLRAAARTGDPADQLALVLAAASSLG